MTGPRVAPPDLPPLHRLLTPDEFHQAQTLSPEALATPGLFPTLPPVPKPSLRAQSDATATPQATGPSQPTIGPLSPNVQDASPGIKADPSGGIPQHGKLYNAAWDVAQYGDAMTRAFIDDVIHKPVKALVNVVPESAIISGGMDALKQSAKGDNAGAAMTALATAPFLAAPVSAEARGYLSRIREAWQTMHAGAPEMAEARGILRSTTGRMAAQYEQAAFHLDEFRRIIDPLPDEHKLALIDAIETGKWKDAAPPPAPISEASQMRRSQMDGARAARGGLDPTMNPYQETSPLHAVWKQGYEGVPEEDFGAENVLKEGKGSAEGTKQVMANLAEERTMGAAAKASDAAAGVDYSAKETAQPTIDPAWRPFIEQVRSTLDGTRDAIRNLGTGKLDSFIEDYFPHIWDDPDRAADVFRTIGAKGPLEGPASFLKERTIPTVKEGIAAGLKPVSTNPIDLTLLKLREMQRYLMAHTSLNELKDAGLVKYVPAGGIVPDGHSLINDKIATAFGPREGAVTLPEGATKPGEPAPLLNGQPLANADLPEHVVAAAIKSMDGRVFVGNMHFEATEASQGHIPNTGGPKAVGFITNKGRYVSRSEAARYAVDKVVARMKRAGDTEMDATDFGKFKFGVQPGELTMGATTAPMVPEDVSVPGRRIMGQYFAPEPVAGLVNNYLSPGLPVTLQKAFPGPLGKGAAMAFDAYRGLGNTLNQAQLGFSAFHLGFTSLDATTSRTALGLEYLASKQPVEGFKKIITAPIAALPGIIQGTLGDAANALSRTATAERFGIPRTDFAFGLGAKIRQAYLNPENASPEMQALANAVKEAGGRIRQDSFYQNNAVDKFWDAFHAGNPVTTAYHGLSSIMELASKPIMEHIVPLQKLQVFGEMAQKALADLPPEASLADRRAALGSAWDSTDNRMGQLVYDNLFWNKTFKDLAMASTRSVGWNLGTIRELGGGVVDAAGLAKDLLTNPSEAELSHRAAYLVALPITVGTLGAAYQYLRTGEGPKELKDYFFPRTGDVDADGNPDRVQLPSYMKDLFAYSGHPWETLTHKVSPLPSMVAEMLGNQDFYGDEIRNPHDPIVKQLQQEAEFLAKTVEPFAWRNYSEQKARGDNLTTRLSSGLGITPAKREDVRSPAENLMHDYAKEHGSGGATPEMVEARQERAQVLAGLRGNRGVDLEASVTKALESGNLTPPQLARLLKRAGMTPDQERFKALPLEEAVNVFKSSSEREKAKFAEILAKKIERASK